MATTLDVLRTTAEIYDQRLNKVDEAKGVLSPSAVG